MNDAIVHTGIVVATAASLMLAVAAHETVPLAPVVIPLAAPTPPADSPCTSHVADPDQRNALELACSQYGDHAHPFEVVSTEALGPLRAVFVRRSTGNCGDLTVAVMFRGNDIEVVDKLGDYGRSGGPDAIRLLDVVGHPVIQVDHTISMQGTTETYREYFVLDRHRLDRQLCLLIEGSDAGARQRASEWASSNWIADEGTMYFSPSYTKRGEVTTQLYAFAFQFKAGHWVGYETQGKCLDPRLPDEHR